MKRRSSRHDFPYAGLLHCARCGGGVTAETQKGRHGIGSYIYYHCARTAGECSKRGIREETLELEIDRHLSGLSITKEMGELVRDALRDWAKAEFAGLDGVYEEQTKTLVESERRLSGLLDLRLAGVIDTATYQTKEAELKGIVSRLRGEVSKVQGQVDQTRETVENAIAFCETAHVRFQLGGLFERREVARLLGIRYSLLDGKVEVKPNPIFLHLHRVFAPISENIEPLKTGSESKKRTAPEGAVLHGWATRTKIEILSSVFQSVRDENLTFTRPSWLIAH